MSVDYSPVMKELKSRAIDYCRGHGLSLEKLAAQYCFEGGGSNPITLSVTYAQPNPNAHPEWGMGDDANLPFPTLVSIRYGGWRGEPIRYEVKETPFTQKYLV